MGAESLALDGLQLISGHFGMEELEMPPPRKRLEWVQGDDSDGALLLRDPLFENREITCRLRVRPQASMDAVLARIADLEAKLEEAEKQRDGLPLVWTPNGSTKSYTLYVLSGELTGVPIVMQGADTGWFQGQPIVTVQMTARPFGYGTEVIGTPVSSTLPLMTLTIPGVAGDVPAEARLIITDNAAKARRHVEWGLEQRHYTDATPAALLLDSDSLVTSGFAGTGNTRTGAYDPDATGNNVIRATLATQLVAVCGTGNQPHVGMFRVKARIYASSLDVRVRLAWQTGDGPFSFNGYATPPVEDALCEVDLGVISIPEKTLGTQRWVGRIEAYSATVDDTIDIDVLELVPAGEGYGKARGAFSYKPGPLVARDEFTATTAGGALNARVAPSGGTWATSGATTDFAFADGPGSGEESVSRATTADTGVGRFAILGSTNYTDTEVGVIHQITGSNPKAYNCAAVARWVDANNWLTLLLDPRQLAFNHYLSLVVNEAGVGATFASKLLTPIVSNTWYGLRLVCFASGRAIGQLTDAAGNVIDQVEGQRTSLATGGALATGKPGFKDFCNTGGIGTRYYDKFYAATPAAEPIAIHPSQSLEVRAGGDDACLREDSSGVYWGEPPSYRGSRFYLPEAGDENRVSRIAAKARRNDVDVADDPDIADSLTVQVNHTPRYLAVPH